VFACLPADISKQFLYKEIAPNTILKQYYYIIYGFAPCTWSFLIRDCTDSHFTSLTLLYFPAFTSLITTMLPLCSRKKSTFLTAEVLSLLTDDTSTLFKTEVCAALANCLRGAGAKMLLSCVFFTDASCRSPETELKRANALENVSLYEYLCALSFLGTFSVPAESQTLWFADE
jgi:hypothetical protein